MTLQENKNPLKRKGIRVSTIVSGAQSDVFGVILYHVMVEMKRILHLDLLSKRAPRWHLSAELAVYNPFKF